MEQSFWESNLFQTLVMIITVFVTGIIYVLNKGVRYKQLQQY